MTFYETSFFRPATSTFPVPELPSPALVRKESQAQGHRTLKFKHLNLVVKFGDPSWVRLEEAQVMRRTQSPFLFDARRWILNTR